MDLEQFSGLIPDYAKDLRLNLGSVLRQPELHRAPDLGHGGRVVPLPAGMPASGSHPGGSG